MGWVKPGDWCLDVFAGVALGGLDAMAMGLNWIGVELEEKFVKLGKQNIELWQRQLRGWPGLGTARIIQGDSRNLRRVIEGADILISSPPFTPAQSGGGIMKSGYTSRPDLGPDWVGDRTYANKNVGHTPGNLANMKEGDIDLICSSPPYAGIMNEEKCGIDYSKVKKDYPGRVMHKERIKMMKRHHEDREYGESPGQLSSMKEGSINAIISSPPYEGSSEFTPDFILKPSEATKKKYGETRVGKGSNNVFKKSYGNSEGQLGATSGPTFWSASKIILQQCFELLRPGGHAIFVTKNYIKAGKVVPFSDRWLALCESVGFKLVCRHRALLVKEYGTQITISGEEKLRVEKKSFFRRLAEAKGSPRIDNEDVLCLVKQ